MVDREYTNVFVDVHKKIKAFKDRLREANKGDAALREDRLVRETKEMEITDSPSYLRDCHLDHQGYADRVNSARPS